MKFEGLDCILLIDDDSPTNFIHTRVIQKAGIDTHVEALTSAIDALDYLKRTGKYEGMVMPQPGIIFLDINMPAMNGWEFLEEYKDLPPEQKSKVIVIMLTTSLNPDDRNQALAYEDVITFLNKPLRADSLIELINSHYKVY